MTTKLPCMLCGKPTEFGNESCVIDFWMYGSACRSTFEYCVSCGKKILADLDKKSVKALKKWGMTHV